MTSYSKVSSTLFIFVITFNLVVMRLFFCLFGLLFSLTVSAQNRLLARTINPVAPLFSENPGQGFLSASAGPNFTHGFFYSGQVAQSIYRRVFLSVSLAGENANHAFEPLDHRQLERSLWTLDLSLGYQLPNSENATWQQALMLGFRNSSIDHEASSIEFSFWDYHRARSREYRLAYHLVYNLDHEHTFPKKVGFLGGLSTSLVQVYSVETPVIGDSFTGLSPAMITGAIQGDLIFVLEPSIGFWARFNQLLTWNIKVNGAFGLHSNPGILGNNLLFSTSLQFHWPRVD